MGDAVNRKLSLLAALAAVLAACQASPWGPLAVTDEDARIVLEARGGAGPLRVGTRCVTLLVEEVEPRDHPRLAQWPDILGSGRSPGRVQRCHSRADPIVGR